MTDINYVCVCMCVSKIDFIMGPNVSASKSQERERQGELYSLCCIRSNSVNQDKRDDSAENILCCVL